MTITEQIKADLAAHIRLGKTFPSKLTLSALSEHYQVSLTPIRYAVDELVDEGMIHRKENGRLELIKKARSAKSRARIKPLVIQPSKGKDFDAQIRKDVIERSLRQDDEYMREQATAEKYGAGRTVVRQVFSRLQGSGLLVHVPRCGWRVSPFSEKDMLNYLEIREMLELRALDLARPHFNEDELVKLLALNDPGSKSKKSKLDHKTHDYWIEHCDNHYIKDFFSRHGEFYNTLFSYAVIDDATKSAMAQEHCDIIHCLLDRDWRGARKALSHHIRDQQTNVSRMISRFSRKR